jgi:hypothetical protein
MHRDMTGGMALEELGRVYVTRKCTKCSVAIGFVVGNCTESLRGDVTWPAYSYSRKYCCKLRRAELRRTYEVNDIVDLRTSGACKDRILLSFCIVEVRPRLDL